MRRIGKWGFIMLMLSAIVWAVVLRLDFSREKSPIWGVVFTPSYARYLGPDWRQTYLALLDELGVRHLRLAAYWNEIEATQGMYDWRELDWMMDTAAMRGAKVILASGRRLPHWPECHLPDWVKPDQEKNLQLVFHTAVVARYHNHPALEMWQVENEPFVNFFGCEASPASLVDKEINSVRSLDSQHQVLITDSGELSSWRVAAHMGDALGVTLYRTVHNRFGYWSYDWIFPPAWYRLKMWLIGRNQNQMMISELQAEPWAPHGITATALPELRKSMDTLRLIHNLQIARRVGFPRVYLWGAEYWFWLKEKHNDVSLWNTARWLWVDQKAKGE